MANAFATEAWDHTSAVLALTYNVNRGPRSKAVTSADFHPYRQRKRPKLTVEGLHSLKSLFEPEKLKAETC